jgi:hypothetical protein
LDDAGANTERPGDLEDAVTLGSLFSYRCLDGRLDPSPAELRAVLTCPREPGVDALPNYAAFKFPQTRRASETSPYPQWSRYRAPVGAKKVNSLSCKDCKIPSRSVSDRPNRSTDQAEFVLSAKHVAARERRSMEKLRRSIEQLAAPICDSCNVEMAWSRSALVAAEKAITTRAASFDKAPAANMLGRTECGLPRNPQRPDDSQACEVRPPQSGLVKRAIRLHSTQRNWKPFSVGSVMKQDIPRSTRS